MKNPQENSALRELFVDQLQDIYWAETHLTDTLQTMASEATSVELRQAFEEHLDVTESQVERLEQVFSLLGEDVEAKTCEAMEGLIEEGEEIIDSTEEGTMVRDCGLIMAAQKVEHYEIATYGSLRTVAEILGYTEAAELLQTTLDEEKDADETLTRIATSFVNLQALQEGVDGE